jgi:hypothetical protein
MKGRQKYLLIALALLTVILSFTNPEDKVHQEAVKTELNFVAQEFMATKGKEIFQSEFSRNMAAMFADQIIKKIAKKKVTRFNLGILSFTELEFQDKTNIVGIGAFNTVFIAPQMRSKLEELFQDKIGQ